MQNSLRFMKKDDSPPAICMTHIGKRENYEDNFLFNGIYLSEDMQKRMKTDKFFSVSGKSKSKVQVYAVSDGMGGHNAGEIASRICTEKLAECEDKLQRCRSIKEAVDILQIRIAEINTTVYEMGCSFEEWRGMGATLVLFIACGKECAVLNVGDSRAYFFSNNKLVQITKDHTEGQRMLDLGLLTRKEILGFPARKHLSRYIGYGGRAFTLHADEYTPFFRNGIILLCSDGITDALSDRRISDILSQTDELEYAGRRMIEEAAASDNADNMTVMLVSWRGDQRCRKI